MTQISQNEARLSAGPGSQVDKGPPEFSSFPDERENPGHDPQGGDGVGAAKPTDGERTADDDV